MLARTVQRVFRPEPDLLPRAEIALVRLYVVDRPLRQPALFFRAELEHQRVDDRAGEPLLHVEHIIERAAVALRPEVLVCSTVDQLGDDAEIVPRLPHAPLEHVLDVELPRDGPRVFIRALEHSRGVSRDHAQRTAAREAGDDLLGEPVAQVGVLRIGAHVVERQHDDRFALRHDVHRWHGGLLDRCGLRLCALHTLRRDVERPGEGDGDGKPEDREQDDEPKGPIGESKPRDQLFRGPPDDEGDGGVYDSHAEDTPPLQFLQQPLQTTHISSGGHGMSGPWAEEVVSATRWRLPGRGANRSGRPRTPASRDGDLAE